MPVLPNGEGRPVAVCEPGRMTSSKCGGISANGPGHVTPPTGATARATRRRSSTEVLVDDVVEAADRVMSQHVRRIAPPVFAHGLLFVDSGFDHLEIGATEEVLSRFVSDVLGRLQGLNDARFDELKSRWQAVKDADAEEKKISDFAKIIAKVVYFGISNI